MDRDLQIPFTPQALNDVARSVRALAEQVDRLADLIETLKEKVAA